MTSATATRPVTDAEIEAFHRDGAVLLRGVLEPQWVDLVATGLDECYAQPDSMSSELVMPGAILRIDQFPAARSARLRRFIEDSPVGSLVGAVLGAPVRFYMDQMFYKPAGELMATAWHQDTCYYNVDGHDLVRAWVSPDRVPRSASVEVVRGSHRWNVTYRPLVGRDPDASQEEIAARAEAARRLGIHERGGEGFSYGNAVIDKSLPPTPDVSSFRGSFDIMGWDYEPGDVILFHGNILHGAAGQVTLDHHRRAHAAMFAGPEVHYIQRPGQVIPDPAALSEHQPRTGQTLDAFDDVFPLVWAPDTRRDRRPNPRPGA